MAPLKIGVLGCAGRMGQAVLTQIAGLPDMEIAGGSELRGSDWIGRDLGEITGLGPVGMAVSGDPAGLFASSDAVVDFTAPSATQGHAALAGAQATPLVIGTTGLGAKEEGALAEASAQEGCQRGHEFRGTRCPKFLAPAILPMASLTIGPSCPMA